MTFESSTIKQDFMAFYLTFSTSIQFKPPLTRGKGGALKEAIGSNFY